MVEDPPIALLDEISADLDSQAEEDVMRSFEQSFRGKTEVSISHRLAAHGFFQRKFEVHEGRVEEVPL